jgi:hypothetical protein
MKKLIARPAILSPCSRNQIGPGSVRFEWRSLGLLLCLAWLSGCAAQPTASTTSNGVGIPSAPAASEEESAASREIRFSHRSAGDVPITTFVPSEDTLQTATGNGDPDATFRACWYKQGRHRYQAVNVTVGKAGAYAFNAILYHGTTCNPNDYADQFGFGQLLNLGESTYTFWFTAFRDRPDMSALWYVGDENSRCVSYESAPDC